jgi:anti-sigma factor RsiW
MTRDEHDPGTLAAYTLNALEPDEQAALEDHLAGCEQCRRELSALRESASLLGEMPPEALLDGPPEDAGLLLQRTVRQVRAESERAWLHRRVAIGVAAVLMVVVGAVGGVVVTGQEDSRLASPTPTAQPTVEPLPEGTRVGSHVDPRSGARMTARVVPADGWVRINAAVNGVPQGQRCRLWVVTADGTRRLAGSWLVSAEGATEGTSLDGTALVDPADVSAVEVDNVDGDHFVSVTF